MAKANNTPYGLSAGVWTDKGSRILWMADQLRAGVVWANTFNKFDPTSPFGGYKESGYGREGGRHGLEGYVTTGETPVSPTATRKAATPARTARGRQEDLRALHRRLLPAQRVGPVLRGHRLQGRFLANAAQASRKDAGTRWSPRGGVPRLVRRDRLQPGQVLYRVAEVMEGRFDQFVAEVTAAEGLTAARPEPRSPAIDRWVWYAGWSDKLAQVLGGLNPVAGRTSTSPAPEPTGVVAALAPQSSSLLGLVGRRADHGLRQHLPWSLTSACSPLPAITLSEALATSTCPAAWSTSSPAAPPRSPRGWPRTATSTRSTSRAPPTPRASSGATSSSPRPTTLKRVLRPAGNGADRGRAGLDRTPDLRRLRAFLETKTVWHPKGR